MVHQLAILITLVLGIEVANSQTLTQNQTGIHNGFYYSFWNDSTSGSALMTLESNGRYTTKWSNVGNLLLEKVGQPEKQTE